jgi:DNA-binding PadR family transcriptional regulator
MTPKSRLGEFEYLLLLAVLRLDEDAYGVTIRQEIEDRTGRPVSLGSIYPTMDRLEAKGFITSRMGEPTGERGGRSRRYFRLEPDGIEAVKAMRQTFDAMWDGVELGTT